MEQKQLSKENENIIYAVKYQQTIDGLFFHGIKGYYQTQSSAQNRLREAINECSSLGYTLEKDSETEAYLSDTLGGTLKLNVAQIIIEP